MGKSGKSFGVNLGVELGGQHHIQEEIDRFEENCDRESKSFVWGLYEYEKVDCPEPQDGFDLQLEEAAEPEVEPEPEPEPEPELEVEDIDAEADFYDL